jgi:uncharacterized membrane protein YeaQ/YmgE (transglycosylase-associated protein family)
MSILAWIMVGLIVGWLACALSRGSGYGIVGDIIIGIVGALLGGCVMSVVFGYSAVSGLDVVSIVAALLGAIILIAIFHAMSYPERV